MKRLTLLRHGKSSWADATLPDRERPLAKRGQRDVVWLASTLASVLPEPDQLLVSTAQRALATAEALLTSWPALVPQLDVRLYLASTSTLLSVLRQLPDDAEHVLIVGHHPGLSELACRLAPSLQHWLDRSSNGRLGETELGPESEPEPVLATAGAVSLTANVSCWRDFANAPTVADTLLTPALGVLFSPREPARVQAVQQALMKDLAAVQQVLELSWEPAPDDVHFLRTRVKRLRAGLRLLQPLFGASSWRQQDDALRVLAKRYAPLREYDVKQALNVAQQGRQPLRHRLWQQQLPAAQRQQAAEQLKLLAAQARLWPTMTLPDRQIIADIARSYRRARQAGLRAASSGPADDLHRWRLRVKRLLLQLELAAAPLPDKRMLQRLHALANALGEHHDRELLLQIEVNALAAKQQEWLTASAELTKRAFELGDLLFVDKRPRWLMRCFERSRKSESR